MKQQKESPIDTSTLKSLFNELFLLEEGLLKLRSKKHDVVKSQKYEEAAQIRNEEKKIIQAIESKKEERDIEALRISKLISNLTNVRLYAPSMRFPLSYNDTNTSIIDSTGTVIIKATEGATKSDIMYLVEAANEHWVLKPESQLK